MGYWKQDRAFSLAKMGKTKNFCLRNVRLGYGIGGKYANAKQAMNENVKKGTIHPLSSIPTNVTVPVFSAQGTWGHVEVCLNGTYYSDGVRVGKPNASYQWGEFLNGVRVVSYVHTGGGGSSFKVGDSVIVNGQGYATSKGTGAKTKNFVNRKMKIISIANGRYGCNQYNRNGGITGWWSGGHLKKA